MSIRSSSPQPDDTSIAAPVSALVHAALADRPLEEVAGLITLLEQSPQYARATVDALRAVGTDRSVEDVTRLVSLLTRPPRDADCADEAIRAAAESRPVEDVTRLMALLHQAPLEAHCGQEAARAAAARPVEELVELIGRLSEERDAHADRLTAEAQQQPHGVPAMPEEPEPEPESDAQAAAQVDLTPRILPRTPNHRPVQHSWLGVLAAAVLLLCGMLWFPLHRDGAPPQPYGLTLGASALCTLLAVLLTLRPTLPAFAVAAVVPSVLAAGQLYEGRFHSEPLSRALDLTLAPSWIAGVAAVCAALAALTGVLVGLAAQQPKAAAPPRPPAAARRIPD
ncbi:hypothetical protein ABZZ74_08710 [Streptomyces sp. NPDC006476]|uniref:hypothetical protein n=1 Tax=Streptomyces sp. NPDC006476 TaxID=3157175 RepID=UPI0033A77BA0